MSIQPNNTQPTYKVIQTIKVASNNPAKLGTMDRLVTYQVNGRNSYTIRLPADSTSEQIQAAIKADYAKEAKILNLEFK